MRLQASLADRLGSTMFLAILAHGVVILGITFTVSPLDQTAFLPSLNVTLVVDGDEAGPREDDSNLLANRNLSGAGRGADGRRATTELPASQSLSRLGDPIGADADNGAPESQASQQDQLVARSRSEHSRQSVPEPAEDQADTSSRAITLLESPDRLSLAAELDSRTVQPDEPRSDDAVVSPSARAAVEAQYLVGWRQRVERIGTANFPAEYLGEGTGARPTVEVTIGANGELEEIVVRRSSGNRRLDQAALDILRLAAPFEPLPNVILAERRTLRIAYEWDFSRDGGTTH